MIRDIVEINFPEYATLSTATASLVDMGDKTITAQVKIDGSIAPDFSYDWKIEFQGERYIQPLRKPQGSKGNESICSVIDLTFYHKGIYDLKRYFFVSTVELDAGTLMADNYIVPLRLNIAEFVTYLNNVLKYYYGDTYKVFLNPDYEYDETDRKDIDINYTKIWDVVTKIYEWFGVRWSWETQQDVTEYYAIKIGYPSDEVSHIFEYGFEGGLLKFERQVQSPEIANVVFGRGSSENIPYRYFKNKSEDNPTFPADPDWIPELENVYFANLRGKTFRDYVKGWKAKHYGGEVMSTPTDEYTRGYNDATFNPIEYVKDDESIAKYGEIQKGLEHNEEIKPTIQGVTIEGIGRVDQVVDVEPILVDESTENSALGTNVIAIDETIKEYVKQQVGDARNISVATPNVSVEGNARIVKDITVDYVQHIDCEEVEYYSNGATGESYSRVIRRWRERQLLTKANENISIINGYTHLAINDLVNIPSRTPFHILADAQLYGFVKRELLSSREDSRGGVYNIWLEPATSFDILAHIKTEVDYTPIHGLIFGNYENGVIRKSKSITIPKNGVGQVVFTTEPFAIAEENAPATSVDMPFRVIASLDGAQYDARPNVVAINVNTGKQVASINLPAGTYYLQNSIQINNLASKSQTFKVELLPTYIYYSYESTSWKPTFDIWVKNIWQTQKKFTDVSVGDFKLYETDDQYASRVWDAILGSHLGDDAKVVFSSGWLSGHSDWEFTIAHRPVYDTSKTIDGVPSEWRITLYKSDAEMEATSKWLPSIATHANAGDYFYFTGIELPHQYVLWAEERLDKYKREELDKVSDVDSTIVVQLDKVRLNQLQDGEARPLLNSLRVGNNIKVADSRFIASSREVLHLQSVTYTWDASIIMLPNIEVVLSDDVVTSSNPIKNMQYRIGETLKNVDAIRANSLAQISKAKKSIRDANASIKALSTGSLDVTNQVKALIGNDPWMSAREIAEDAINAKVPVMLNPLEERVSAIEGDDEGKSMRAVALEVLGDVNIEGDLSAFITQINSNTAKIETLVGSDKSTSVRDIANNAIDQKTILLEDAATSQDDNDDGLVTAKDAVTYFASKSYVNRDVNRIDREIAGIEASMSDLEEDIKGVDAKANNALTQLSGVVGDVQTAKATADSAVATANDVKKKANNNEANIERLGQDVVGIEDTLGTLNGYINTAAKKANDAYSRAETALEEADGAKELAETANETATKANTTADSVRAQMSGVLTQVQNNTTQIGIIGKDYLRKDQAAVFATDLTGVVEATAEEFVYRPSAGEKSIRDKSAVIRRIKGNSVVWEQKIQAIPERENFEGATTYYDYDTNECVVQNISRTSNYTSGSTRLGIKPDYYSVPNHVYLLLSDKHYKGIGVHSYTLGFQNVNTIKRYTAKDNINFRIDKTFDWANVCPVGGEIRFRMMLFDLTAMFGEGNEPATVEEFRKVYNEAYYPYCKPELRGVKTGAIKTVGFNLFDGECARVIGGMSYIVSNYTSAYYSETKNGAQTAVLIKDGVYTPECSGYLYLTGTADATPCVHFQHSGVMDDKCAPYEEHILNLPEILKLFPNGMHGLRNTYHDVYDEINIDNYIKRLEIVDLGSLWWNSDSSRQCFHAPLNTHKVRGIALCTRYTCSTLGGISDKQLSTHDYYGSDRIFIKDVDFDNPTDFMASLQGVYLVYELNEPIITPLSEPITLDYYCEDWGSEEAMPASSASAPFRADIVYQFNAEGRIRDNSRNIDKLEKIVTPLKNIPSNASLATQGFVLSQIPTHVATATERVKMYEGQTQLLKLLPNVMYDWTGGGSLLGSITIPPLYINTETIGTYDHQWMVRVGSDTSDKVTIPFDVLWKDGIAPNWTSWGICEITFKCDAQQDEAMGKIIGEWKIYK